ncbi:hypothetical protein L3Y34_005227 [Caenorhabditis briggsae]|uniref:Uncharacterized protein n=1 Tax=Caenorhabditis briggsae TaxID=6238 RepID=A0AAE9AIY3_CAEBR|nr:hypothetical protein L3Y34_005227 [Caenorhabditis briggsae]
MMGVSPMNIERYVEKRNQFSKELEQDDDTKPRKRRREDVEDSDLRKKMDRNCEYTKKHTKNKENITKKKKLELIEKTNRVELLDEVINRNERMATNFLSLNSKLGGTANEVYWNTYEAHKHLFISKVNEVKENDNSILKIRELFNEKKKEFEEKSEMYEESAIKAKNLPDKEKKRATNSAGSAKSRAKAEMISAELDYDVACLNYIIFQKEWLFNLSMEFAIKQKGIFVERAIFEISENDLMRTLKIKTGVLKESKSEFLK